jgi:hypothetical protein
MNGAPVDNCPDALRRLLDADEPLNVRRSVANTPTFSLRCWWGRLMTWAPTEAQTRRVAEQLRRTASICDFWLKVAVIAAMIFMAIEVAEAFLPGGAVGRVLGGAR